jgi:hypothetical protein
MGSHDLFEYLKHNLWLKKWSGVKVSIWLLPLKVKNHFEICACEWNATYRWKALDKGYNFVSHLISIEGLHKKLWPSEVPRILILGVSKQNDILIQPPRLIIDNTIRGKVMASPKSGLWWILWVYVCPWFIRAPKVFKLCTSQLVLWFV